MWEAAVFGDHHKSINVINRKDNILWYSTGYNEDPQKRIYLTDQETREGLKAYSDLVPDVGVPIQLVINHQWRKRFHVH